MSDVHNGICLIEGMSIGRHVSSSLPDPKWLLYDLSIQTPIPADLLTDCYMVASSLHEVSTYPSRCERSSHSRYVESTFLQYISAFSDRSPNLTWWFAHFCHQNIFCWEVYTFQNSCRWIHNYFRTIAYCKMDFSEDSVTGFVFRSTNVTFARRRSTSATVSTAHCSALIPRCRFLSAVSPAMPLFASATDRQAPCSRAQFVLAHLMLSRFNVASSFRTFLEGFILVFTSFVNLQEGFWNGFPFPILSLQVL